MTNCDIILTPGNEVYINGNRIGGLVRFTLDKDGNQRPELTLTLDPTSIIFGSVPSDTIQTLWDEATKTGAAQADGDVDIHRAISRAQARAAGLDPVQASIERLVTPVSPPPTMKKAKYDEPVLATADMDGEAEYAAPERCGADYLHGSCRRPYGHTGAHSLKRTD